MDGEGDDDEDPDGGDGAMVPSEILIQQILITKKVPSTQDDDFLAPIPYTAPPWWRKSETEVAGTQRVEGIGVAGRDNPMVLSHCQTQQSLITKKVLSTQDDDFLAPILYSTTMVEEVRNRGGGDSKGGWDRCWRVWLGGGGGEGGGVRGRGELQEERGVNCSSLLARQNALERLA